jgi:hypothetical protein
MASAKMDLKNEMEKITQNHLLWSHDVDLADDEENSTPTAGATKNTTNTPKGAEEEEAVEDADEGDEESDANDGKKKNLSASPIISGLEDEQCSGTCCCSLINHEDHRLDTWQDPKALFRPHRAADIISTSIRPLLRLIERK